MRKVTIESGQNIIDIALQEYGNLEAVPVLCSDNNLQYDDDLFPGQELLIREADAVINVPVMEIYKRKSLQVNSRTPSAEVPGPVTPEVDLPSFYGSSPADLDASGILLLTQIFRNKKESDDLPFTSDMARLWYVYPSGFGVLSQIIQPGGYNAITSFDLLSFNLTINNLEYSYYAYRLKHNTYLLPEDNFKITFR